MKRSILLTLALCALSSISFATIWTVDNSTVQAGQFNDADAAVDAASPGDTLLFQPSDVNYGDVFIDKQLVLIGEGAFNNDSPGQTIMNYFYMQAGSSGTIIKGFRIDRTVQRWSGSGLNNILITQNRFLYTGGTKIQLDDNTDGWVIEGNLFQNPPGSIGHIYFNGADQTIIKNNVFESRTNTNNAYEAFNGAPSTTIITNNLIFLGNGRLTESCTGVNFTNNIIYSYDEVLDYQINAGCSSCNYEANLTYSFTGLTFDDLPGNNLNNQAPIFVNQYFDPNDGNPYYSILETDYHLTPASPGYNAGTDGTDLGHFGAGYDYDPYLFPRYPRVTNVTPSVVNVESGQSFTISLEAINK